jgi:hypothetical protein
VFPSVAARPGARYRVPVAGQRRHGRTGNVGIGYSIGNATMFRGQRFAARAAADPLGTLGDRALVLVDSTVAKGGGNRWEDFVTTVVDPTDDATFSYMGDYYKGGSRSIHIGSFRVP